MTWKGRERVTWIYGLVLAMAAAASGAAEAVLPADRGGEIERRLRQDPLMMPYYTGRILPTPRQAEYRDEFLPMGRVAIVVGAEVENPLPLVELLSDRIVRYGGVASVVTNVTGVDCDAVVSLGNTDYPGRAAAIPALPEREQGYILHATRLGEKPLIVLKGRDRLGLLWAVSSLIQLIHWRDGKTVARAAEVTDYPLMPRRGLISVNLGANAPGLLTNRAPVLLDFTPPPYSVEQERQFLTLCKFNEPVYRALSFQKGWNGDWRKPEKQADDRRETIRKLKELITPLGITWYGGFWAVQANPGEKAGGDEESGAALLHYARQIEDAGGHFTLMLDDVRFPLNPADKTRFGSARETDTFMVTNLLASLKKTHPNARLLVCPPFYWGPEGSVPGEYGEPREPYLKMAGERWPPEVEIFWSGSRVNNTILATKSHLDWITGLIGRKPFLYQNDKYLRGCFRYHYGAEPITSLAPHYWAGFFDRVAWFGANSQMPRKCIVNAIIADFAWNPETHDPERAVREAVGKVVGSGAWEPMARFTEGLQYFERFYNPANMKLPPDPAGRRRAARRFEEVEAKLHQSESALRELLDRFPAATFYWTDLARYLNAQRDFVDGIRAEEGLRFFRAAGEQERQARRELGPDAPEDVFLMACDFEGGILTEIKDLLGDNPSPACVLDDVGRFTETAASFAVTSQPAEVESELSLSACLGGKPCMVKVELNGTVLAEGEAVFRRHTWGTVRLPLPARLLKRDGTRNVLRIRTSALPGAVAEPVVPAAGAVGEDPDGFRLAIRFGRAGSVRLPAP